ncbi:mitochondrial ribosomal protein S10 [Culex quinquefasciatus]|uniref:Small ribosomal subunit protein uS10m n=1 Tax=Culex quinquefasciatus TaxID=7176 RepID=B0WJV6_CULQU|nr:mitochondrial ribosomal protein S10 [Culex quinquefasciatus]|eukprot:XP_001848990.1 mitochondrial ribosomal protein S10 [Culex quinquefasciatus]
MLKFLDVTRRLASSSLWSNHAARLLSTEVSSTASTSPNTTVPVPDKLYSRVELQMKGIDPEVMKSYAYFAKTAAEHLDIEVGKHWALRKAVKDRLTLLKSVHIYKKHRVQYEIRNYYRFMHFHKLTGSTLDTFLEYVERNLPEGVALKVTRVELQALPEHLRPGAV